MNRAPHLILLDERDTILVCVAAIARGDSIAIDGATIAAARAVPVGHKIARRALAPGDKVVKYGAAIGSITGATAAGDIVHLHNMKSDYLATHGRDVATEES